MTKLFFRIIANVDDVWYLNLIDVVAIKENKFDNNITITLSEGTKITTKDKEILNLIETYEYEND
jgi:hypothetical protein